MPVQGMSWKKRAAGEMVKRKGHAALNALLRRCDGGMHPS